MKNVLSVVSKDGWCKNKNKTGAEGPTKKWKKRARKHGLAESLEAFTAQTLLAYILPFARTGVLDLSMGSQSEVVENRMSVEERKSIA